MHHARQQAQSDKRLLPMTLSLQTRSRQAVAVVLSAMLRPGGVGAEAGVTHSYPDGSQFDTLPQWDSILEDTRWDDAKTERTHEGRLLALLIIKPQHFESARAGRSRSLSEQTNSALCRQ